MRPLRRRLLTIPGYGLALVLGCATAPLWIPLGFAADRIRRAPPVALRCGLMLLAYLGFEVIGLVSIGGIALASLLGLRGERRLEAFYRLEAWWATRLFDAVAGIFDLRVEVEEGDAELSRGPYLLLARHTSMADTLLTARFVSRPHGTRVRYVFKRELLWDPCLDVMGHLIPNVFVDRNSDDSASEIERVARLGRQLGARDAVLIYPEGTRFTEDKQRQVLLRFERDGREAMLAYARGLSFVLPPRPGGTLALLDAAPGVDVVVCSHTGFEGTGSLGPVLQGSLYRRRVTIHYHRIPRDEIPKDEAGRRAWLQDQWRAMDAWVAAHREA